MRILERAENEEIIRTQYKRGYKSNDDELFLESFLFNDSHNHYLNTITCCPMIV